MILVCHIESCGCTNSIPHQRWKIDPWRFSLTDRLARCKPYLLGQNIAKKNIHKGIVPQMMPQHVFLDKIQKIAVCKGCNKMHVLFHSVRCQHSIMSHSFARLFLRNFYKLKSKNNRHQTSRVFLLPELPSKNHYGRPIQKKYESTGHLHNFWACKL